MCPQNVLFADIEYNPSDFVISANTEAGEVIVKTAIEYCSAM
jgi:hypothetical protein